MNMFCTLFIFCIFGTLQGLEVIPQKPELEYINKKYIEFMKFTTRRHGRSSPYHVNLSIKTLTSVGNNLTLSMALYEYLSGNYVVLGFQGEYKFCDFLNIEPYLGKMLMKQVGQNLTCPFPKGHYEIKDLVMHLEDFPYDLPFTWESLNVRVRINVDGYATNTKEPVFRYKFYATLNQKPRRRA